MRKIKKNGFSLIEILVALTLISIISVIVTQAVLSSVRGAKRSDSDTKIRQNISYAVTIMERQLRNSKSVTCSPDNTSITVTDLREQTYNFFRDQTGFIASGSANVRLTNSDIDVTVLTFSCVAPVGNTPSSIIINITAFDRNAQGAERSSITTSHQINLRTTF